MTIEVVNVEDLSEIIKMVDEEIARCKSQLGEYLRRFDEVRISAEKVKKLQEILGRALGRKPGEESGRVVNLGDVSFIIDYRADEELEVLEEVVRYYQNRVLKLQKVREQLKMFENLGEEGAGIKAIVLTNDGIPVRVLLKL